MPHQRIQFITRDEAPVSNDAGTSDNIERYHDESWSKQRSDQENLLRLAKSGELNEVWGSPMQSGLSSLSWAIKLARLNAGLSQTELAYRMNSQQPAVARLERADYTGHTTSYLARLASAAGYQLHVVFTREK